MKTIKESSVLINYVNLQFVDTAFETGPIEISPLSFVRVAKGEANKFL